MGSSLRRSIRLCQITPRLSDGGIEERTARILAGLDARDFELTWIGLAPNEGGAALRVGPNVSIRSVCKSRQRGVDLGLVLRLFRILRERSVDIVHVHNWATGFYGITAARLAGVPHVIYGMGGRDDSIITTPRRRAVTDLLAPQVQVFSSVCEFLAKEIVATWRVPEHRVRVIRTGIDVRRFREGAGRRTARDSLGLGEDAFVIGAVGHLRPVKRMDLLVEAAATLGRADDRVHVVIVGSGDRASIGDLMGLSEAAGMAGRVHVLGRRDDPEHILRAFDVFVNCSRFEGSSNATIEAMAAGLPVVATRTGGTPELIADGENGLLVAPDDPQDLSAALRRMMGDASMRARFAERNEAVAERQHGLEHMLNGYLKLYEDVASVQGWGARARSRMLRAFSGKPRASSSAAR